MTPTEKLMQKLIHTATGERVEGGEAVRARYNQLCDEDVLHDYESELRCGGQTTGLQCDYSRHYSSEAVAAEMLDGSWVGWTYFYGGGKHGEPGAIEWMEDAYEVASEVVVEQVRKFRRVGA